MSLYIPYSYRYVSTYMLIPLVYYMVEALEGDGQMHIRSYIYPVLFGCTFTIPVWGLLTPLPADFFIFTPIYLTMIWSFIEDWCFQKSNKSVQNRLKSVKFQSVLFFAIY